MTYRTIAHYIVIATAVLSCTASLRTLTAQTPTVGYGFKVAMTLTPAARRELLERNEKLRLFGYFYGRPKPGVRAPEGEVGLGAIAEQNFDVDAVATVPEVRFKASGLKTMKQGSAELLLNVVSARLSSGDNLLSCDIYEGPPPAKAGLTVSLKCGLITEQPETRTVRAFLDGMPQ